MTSEKLRTLNLERLNFERRPAPVQSSAEPPVQPPPRKFFPDVIIGALHPGRVSDPMVSENQNEDWQQGYGIGGIEGLNGDPIAEEWVCRGEPPPEMPTGERNPAWERFSEWKLGFWSARFRKLDGSRKTRVAPGEEVPW